MNIREAEAVAKKDAKDMVDDLHRIKTDRRKLAFNESAPVQIVRGIWIFTEGMALLVTSLFAIYQGRYGAAPLWGRYTLVIAGVLVLLPAAHLLSKFFRSVGGVR